MKLVYGAETSQEEKEKSNNIKPDTHGTGTDRSSEQILRKNKYLSQKPTGKY
jgi:hypothetical protein